MTLKTRNTKFQKPIPIQKHKMNKLAKTLRVNFIRILETYPKIIATRKMLNQRKKTADILTDPWLILYFMLWPWPRRQQPTFLILEGAERTTISRNCDCLDLSEGLAQRACLHLPNPKLSKGWAMLNTFKGKYISHHHLKWGKTVEENKRLPKT